MNRAKLSMLPREKLILLNLTLVVVPSSTCDKGEQIRKRLWDYGLKGRGGGGKRKKNINQTGFKNVTFVTNISFVIRLWSWKEDKLRPRVNMGTN